MDNLLPDNQISFPVETDELLPEIEYFMGASLEPDTIEPLIHDAWGTVRDELADFLLELDFATDMQTAFGQEVDVAAGKEDIINILTGESLPGIRVLPTANMYPAVGAYDALTGTVYLADSLLDGSFGVDNGLLQDVLLEETGHFLDGLLHEEDSPGDEGALFSRLVKGEELSEPEVLEFLDEDDWVEVVDVVEVVEVVEVEVLPSWYEGDAVEFSYWRNVFQGDYEVETRGWNDVFGGDVIRVEASQGVDFEEVGRFEVGDLPESVTEGDFNRDGLVDLAVANLRDDNVSVLLGTGDGNFASATNFGVGAGDGPWAVIEGNFNGDGLTDLAVVGGNKVSLLFGKGDGSFVLSTNNFNVQFDPSSSAGGDFNGDDSTDLAMVNSTSDRVSVLLGTGDGSFGTATYFRVGDFPEEVALEDFNGDGFTDLAVVNRYSDNVSVLLGKGDGSFGTATYFSVGEKPYSIAQGDFNRDGIPDLVAGNIGSWPDGGLDDSVSVLLGKGDGGFRPATNFDVGGDRPFSLAVEDLNRDGIPDLVAANSGDDNVSVLQGKGDGSFGAATNFDVGGFPRSVAVQDFNEDGLPDLAVANGGSDDVSVLINTTPITVTPKITISDTNITEGNTNKTANFPVTLDNPSNQIITVEYTTINETAKVNQDYKLTKGTLTFQPGETQQTIPVTILGDKRDENNETFKLALSRPQNAELQDKQAIGTIVDNDAPPKISISDATVTEGNRGKKKMEFEVKLNNPSDKTVKVNYTTVDGSAKSGQDYQKKNGVLTFKPGEKEKKVSISVLGDNKDENNEKFEVKLSRAKNAKLSDKKAVGTIRDNDETVIIPEVIIGDAKVTEGNSGKKNMKFEVKLSEATQEIVEVNYVTVDGSAKSGQDYEKVSGVVKFKPGQKKKVVSVPVLGDTRDENNEQFEVKLSRAKNAKLVDGKAVGIIRDNDEPKPEPFPDVIDLGVLTSKQISVRDEIGFTIGGVDRDTEDYFRFEVEEEGFVSIFVDGFVQDLGIKLYDEVESLISQSNVDGLGLEFIENVLEPGVYYLEVFPVGGGRSRYNLNINIV
ncbi:Calx-beta domain-containing protein [Okeania sp.]|uniref:FG-GAP repeat domain-containing protein n=1 Tax=Okeania sp. TaxID=3100323 RepID=UPI002B4AD44F|nr:Calx-beta domain-containing protein [Okeania sp.]MEB3342084.1 Calx-beta domain-containing protein [Okeania sp.]